jgi:myo-inositol-1(or 4)-monophosphatase
MQKVIYLAGGCFWGMEKCYESFPGVISTTVGYANGNCQGQPSYALVKTGTTGCKECLRLTYDDALLPLSVLLASFFSVIDPTARDRQGEDVGSQYQSGIYFSDEATGEETLSFIDRKKREVGSSFRVDYGPLLSFCPAEEYHQKYLDKNPEGYCHIPYAKMRSLKEKASFDILASAVREMGQLAKKMQKGIQARGKADGSPVTGADLAISRRIISLVSKLFPDANIISEEEMTPFREDASLTFVLDPIDGTDVYSQGFPSFAVALGMLDRSKRPVGALIAAPRFGIGEEELFVRLDPGGELLVNGEPFHRARGKDVPRQITMGSNALQHIDATGCSVKLRCLGSSILHLIAPVLFEKIDGSVETTGYIWDIVASHAVLLHEGMDIVHSDGSPFLYDERMFQRKAYIPPIYVGTKACTERLRSIFTLEG